MFSKADADKWIPYERKALTAWQCVSEKVNQSLAADNLPRNIDTVPAGWALTYLVEHIANSRFPALTDNVSDNLNRIFRDTVHLKAEGAFYIAAFSYAYLYNESPVGIPAPNIYEYQNNTDVKMDATLANALLELAWQKAQDYKRDFTTPPTMQQCRTVIAEEANSLCDQQFVINEPDNAENTRLAGECKTWFSNESTSPFFDRARFKRWPAP